MSSTIHASAVLVGPRALLIRGPSGAGKSALALALLRAAAGGGLAFARLVADDRVRLESVQGGLLVRPAATLAGLIEVRGFGIIRLPYEPLALVGHVVDLSASDADRMPAVLETHVAGVNLPRIPIASGHDPLALVLAFLIQGPGRLDGSGLDRKKILSGT